MAHTPPPSRRNFLTYGIGGIVALGAIGTATVGSITSATGGNSLRSSLTLIAPAAAGGGWDTACRELQHAQRAHGIVNNTQVVNMPGAAGTIALNNMKVLHGQAGNIMVGGTGQLAGHIQYDSPVGYEDITPLAVTMEEFDVIVVPADSPYKTLDDLMKAWKQDPRKIPWTGGGAFDQLVTTELALAAGINPKDMIYVSSDGGGESIAALLNGTAKAAPNGYPDSVDQIESGRLRALAVITPEPIPGLDIPTAKEQGYDVSLTNWRLWSAPGGITDEEEKELSAIILESIKTPEWQDAVKRYYWHENVIQGDDLTKFLAEEKTRIEGLYKELGL